MLLLLITCVCVTGCNILGQSEDASTLSSVVNFPKIDRHPPPGDFDKRVMTSIPTYNPDSNDPFHMDFRASDLSIFDLKGALENLFYASFDDRTIWPDKKRMPDGFDRQKIMERGKDPGLGVRALHAKGITGKKVGVAIIDQALLTRHQEYEGQLKFYEEINIRKGTESQMHGAAVASIAVGETVGVAPGADLYYIGSTTGDWKSGGEFTWNFNYYAKAIKRILEINEQLPNGEKIRVIAMQVGWNPKQKGYEEITAAAKLAKAAGMLVVCSCITDVHGFKFHGLGRHPQGDPNNFNSYNPGLWWAEKFYTARRFSDRLLIPMDSRTTASPLGIDEYVFYREGGWSWSMPYIAGLYALAAQVDPAITPKRFWTTAMDTGKTIKLTHKDETINFGPIVDPAALMEALKTN